MITQLGKELRFIRLDNNELLKHMAEKIGITPSYLSSIEHGKIKPTSELINTIIDVYSLDDEHIEKLGSAFMNVKKKDGVIKNDIENTLRQMCFGRSREWSESMVDRIFKTNVINDKCIEDNIVVDEEIIITALMEIVFDDYEYEEE